MSEVVKHQDSAAFLERVIVQGDLSALNPAERIKYYKQVCDSLSLNPLTKPFDYIKLNNKLVLYAKKDCTDQLRALRNISIRIISREEKEGVCEVTARATTPDGREDEDVGAVNVKGLSGEGLANARMKATTKAKRRVTLSICGLGFLDETEVETIPHVEVAPAPPKQIEQQQSAPKKKAGKTKNALLTRLQAKDSELAAAGMCNDGDLIKHLERAGSKAGFGEAIVAWPEQLGLALAVKEVKLFEEACRKPPLCSPEEQKEINSLFNQLDMPEEDRDYFLSERGINPDEVLTAVQAQSTINELRQLVAEMKQAPAREPGDEDDIPY